MPSTSEATVRAFVDAINAADLTTLRALMTGDHTFTDSLGNSFSGAEKMLSGWQHFFHAYPGYRIELNHVLASGNLVALFGQASGKWRSGETVLPQTWKVAAAWLAEVVDAKISRWSVFCDAGWAAPPKP
jgi:ketosteroid isomerase-like protein